MCVCGGWWGGSGLECGGEESSHSVKFRGRDCEGPTGLGLTSSEGSINQFKGWVDILQRNGSTQVAHTLQRQDMKIPFYHPQFGRPQVLGREKWTLCVYQ